MASVGRFLLEVPWSTLLSSYQSCEEKLTILTEIISYRLNTIMPKCSIKVHETDQLWFITQLKQLRPVVKRRCIQEKTLIQDSKEQGQARAQTLPQSLL